MILIFSYFNDTSTTGVIRWLHRLGVEDVVRINEDDPRKRETWVDLRSTSFVVHTHGVTFSSEELRAVWFRKGTFWFDGMFGIADIPSHPALSSELNGSFAAEGRKAREYFHHLIQRNCRVLGSPGCANPNKLILLHMAAEAGLDVPDLMVSNNMSRLAEWAGMSDGRVVTKAMADGLYLWDFKSAGNGYFSYTERSNLPALANGESRLPLSLVQREVKKRFEVRSFFLDGKFFSMAIFSQNDAKTAVDYRKYNYEKPNRTIPFQLPSSVESKLRALFKKLDLNTGSVDLMVDERGRYVFLEINPTGQYAGLSRICNYNLDLKIASWLAEKNGYGTESACVAR